MGQCLSKVWRYQIHHQQLLIKEEGTMATAVNQRGRDNGQRIKGQKDKQ
jgi:formylmethanofuran dehydrogenase subunit E